MLLPYLVLNLSEEATDEEIRNRYLDLVKRYTPEKAPDRFRIIDEAYETLKERRRRVEARLQVYTDPQHYGVELRRLATALQAERRPVALKTLFEAEERP
jgi:curved DNA-binding protein CbpA